MDLISKYDLIEKIVQTTDETVLQQVKQLLEVESLEDIDRRLRSALNKSLKQADKREVRPHKEVMSRIKKKYLKK
jgi:hypothetical protein